MAVDQTLFKQALAQWASGVTIVTTKTDAGYAGMTASAFSSVSADPPIILVCINQSAESCALVAESGSFAVNILESSQQDASNRFASFKDKETRFDSVAWSEAPSGSPYLDESLCSLDCKVVNKVEAGSHIVFFGEVQHVVNREGNPVLYYRGGYRGIEGL